MDACRRVPTFATRMAGCAIVLQALVGAAAADPTAIRLPDWMTASPPAAVRPAAMTTAPKPPTLGPTQPRDLRTDLADAVPIPTPGADSKPLSLETRLRQLEHAASGAESAHALTRLLRRYEPIRDAARAAADDRAAVRADRVASWAYASRGRLGAADGRLDRAIDDFRTALSLDPTNLTARHALASTLAESGRLDEGLREFSRVLTTDPNSYEALLGRARTHYRLGAFGPSVADCDAALRALPAGNRADRAAALRLRGTAHHALGRLRDAATDLNGALRLDPADATALVARGHVFAEGGFYDQAISDYVAASHADPAGPEAYRAMAWVLSTCPEPRLRNAATAMEAAWRAQRLGGIDDFLTLEASAAAHAASGDFAQAIRLQQRALLSPDAPASEAANDRLRTYQARRPYIALAPSAAPAPR